MAGLARNTQLDSVESLKGMLQASDVKLDGLISSLTTYRNNRTGQYPTYDSDFNEVSGIVEEISTAFFSFGGTEQKIKMRLLFVARYLRKSPEKVENLGSDLCCLHKGRPSYRPQCCRSATHSYYIE